MPDDRRVERESTEEMVGEGVGGITGGLAGAGLGAAAGPVGVILGGLAGALGGWWAGERIGRAVDDWTDREERVYREHWDRHGDPNRLTYEDAMVGYGVGHVAAHNPAWTDRSFEEVEGDLRENWRHERYNFELLRPYVRRGYER